jgi:hypothetical protein
MPQELFDTIGSRIPAVRQAAALLTWRQLTAEQKMEYRDYIDESDRRLERRSRHRHAARRLARGRKSPSHRWCQRLLVEGLLALVTGVVGGWASR